MLTSKKTQESGYSTDKLTRMSKKVFLLFYGSSLIFRYSLMISRSLYYITEIQKYARHELTLYARLCISSAALSRVEEPRVASNLL